jgi:hypothetical protein
MTGEYITTQSAKTLAVDNIEPAPDLDGGWKHKTEHGSQGVRSPGRHIVELNVACAITLDAVSEDVNLMFFRKPGRQFRYIAAMSAGTMVIMNDVGDLHKDIRMIDLYLTVRLYFQRAVSPDLRSPWREALRSNPNGKYINETDLTVDAMFRQS